MKRRPPLELDPDWCRKRQTRLVEILKRKNLDYAFLLDSTSVQYFTGFRPHPLLHAGVIVEQSGQTTLLAPNEPPEQHAASHVLTYEAQWRCTLRQDQLAALIEKSFELPVRKHKQAKFGTEQQFVCLLPADVPESLDEQLWRLRRRKDPDELTLIQRAIDCTEMMYQTARRVIEPGITELDVFSALQSTAVDFLGEPPTATGNDFQCNSPGGPPRPRPAKAGELFILDLGPAYRGYYADNCRTICVGTEPTPQQQQAWQAIVGVLEMVEQTVRPGTSAKQLFQHARQMLDASLPDAFFHHLGHGIGLFPHETPHLNDCWDDTFCEGDVFTAEPGLYAPELRAGIRLEQNYRVTADGVERLTNFSLEL